MNKELNEYTDQIVILTSTFFFISVFKNPHTCWVLDMKHQKLY